MSLARRIFRRAKNVLYWVLMTGVNHALTGAAIGLLLKNPLLVVPAAFASHLVLDVVPHFGSDWFIDRRKPMLAWAVTEGVLSASVTLILIILWPQYWYAIGIGAFAAVAPDVWWVIPLLLGKGRPQDAFTRFHGWIQWGEFEFGSSIEVIWTGLMAALLASLPK